MHLGFRALVTESKMGSGSAGVRSVRVWMGLLKKDCNKNREDSTRYNKK